VRILTVSHYFNSNGSGVEIIAAKIRGMLQEQGISVRWIAAQAKNSVTDSYPSDKDCVGIPMWDGIREKTDLAWPIPSPMALPTFYQEVRAADLVHLHEPFYPACQLAYWFAKLLGKPVIITQHIADMPAGRLRSVAVSLANEFLTRPVHCGAKKIVYYSDRTRQYFGLVADKKDVLILNGCDTEVFRCPEPEESKAIRLNLALPLDRPVALFVGRFIKKKGLTLLRGIASRNPGIQFVFVGRGPLNPALWQLPNVRVVPSLNHTDLAYYYQSADLLLLPSVGEGFPLVVQEAMCSGLPCVVSTDVAVGCPEIIDKYILAGPAGVGAEQAILRYLDNPMTWEDRRNLAAQAREMWSWYRCAEEYEALFMEVVARAN